jgi:type IV secretory pathway VirB3-like protein
VLKAVPHRPNRGRIPLGLAAVALTWGAYFVLSPFDVFPNGYPQPADAVLAASLLGLFSCRLLRLKFPARALPALLTFGAMTAVVTVVSLSWAVKYPDDVYFLRSPVFYWYNLAIFAAFLACYQSFGSLFLRAVFLAIVVTLFGQVLILPFAADFASGRQTLFFNNPNQLGFFSLLIGCMVVALRQESAKMTLVGNAALTSAILLAILSLSKAALAGMGCLLLLILVRRPAYLVVCVALLCGVAMLVNVSSEFQASAGARVTSAPAEFGDNIDERGYGRLLRYPEYMILGAGEGATWRFDEHHELHSSFGVMLFGYGVLGLTAFLAFLFSVMRAGGVGGRGLLMIPPLLYGFTHQGLRTTHFWLLAAVIICVESQSLHGNRRSNTVKV